MFKKKRLLTYLLPIQIILVNILSRYPNLIEKYYSNGIYPYISSFFRVVLGWIPFSIGDILLLFLLIYILVSIYRFIKKKPKKIKNTLFSLGAHLSIFYFVFYMFWGMNYYRIPLQKSLDLTIPEYNIDELSLLTEKLLMKTQEIHFKLTKNDTIPIQTVLSQKELLERVNLGYDSISKSYKQFEYSHPKVKKSLFSTPMSYMGFSGYLNPITGESQINYNSINFDIPFVACHEIAHQIGYANESEANFIGYLAAINNKDLLFQYSANLAALRYALGEIYRSDKNLHKEFFSRLPIGVKKNINDDRKLWKKYNNPLKPYFHKFYSLYLKANHQKDGMKSYGKMIGLLMAYENKYNK